MYQKNVGLTVPFSEMPGASGTNTYHDLDLRQPRAAQAVSPNGLPSDLSSWPGSLCPSAFQGGTEEGTRFLQWKGVELML